jgi:oligoribonuclease (3'-5' exoribonuclease)
MSSLIILDFETTGLNPERDQILEMAMVALEYGTLREVAAVSTCLNVPSGVFGLCDDRRTRCTSRAGSRQSSGALART